MEHNPRTFDRIVELLETLPARLAAAMADLPDRAAEPAFDDGPSFGATGGRGGGGEASASSAATEGAGGEDDALGAALDLGHAVGGPLGKLAGKVERAFRIARSIDRLVKALQPKDGAEEPDDAHAPDAEADEPEPAVPIVEADAEVLPPEATPSAEPPVIDAEWREVAQPAAPQLEYRPTEAASEAAPEPEPPPAAEPPAFSLSDEHRKQLVKEFGAKQAAEIERRMQEQAAEPAGPESDVEPPVAADESPQEVLGAEGQPGGADDEDATPGPKQAWEWADEEEIEDARPDAYGGADADSDLPSVGGSDASGQLGEIAQKADEVLDKFSDLMDQVSDAAQNMGRGPGGHGMQGQGGEEDEGFESAEGLGEDLVGGAVAEAGLGAEAAAAAS